MLVFQALASSLSVDTPAFKRFSQGHGEPPWGDLEIVVATCILPGKILATFSYIFMKDFILNNLSKSQEAYL
jgi:hypothetical protein